MNQTIDFHYDVDGYNFMYANFYLVDTNAGNGAHVLIQGSSRRKRWRDLMGVARLTDVEALAAYGRAAKRVIEGPVGFGFLEDSSCYHRSCRRFARSPDPPVALSMTVPALGFGTAPIMGRVSRRRGLAALELAHAAGICHFDRARSCGWGEAEGVVGTFLRGHAREDIRLVTKCGIVPVRRSAMLRAATTMGRLALSLAPGLGSRGRQIASSTGFRPSYAADPDSLAASLQTSLRELGVSYVDVLLLHNFLSGMAGLEEVAAWFSSLKQSGVMRQHGFSVEGGLKDGLSFLARHNLLADTLVQAPVNDVLLTLPREWRNVPIIAHSPFEFLRAQARIASFADLLHALGERCRCEALVCSMFNPAHLAANVEAWRKSK